MARIKELIGKYERTLRFLIAGAFNSAVGLSVFPLLLWLSPWLYHNYMVGLVISQVVCTLIAFGTYRLGVFAATGRNIFHEFAVFCSFYAFNYVSNWIALPLMVRGAKISPIYAQTFFTVVLMIGSYFWHSRVTFREKAQG